MKKILQAIGALIVVIILLMLTECQQSENLKVDNMKYNNTYEETNK